LIPLPVYDQGMGVGPFGFHASSCSASPAAPVYTPPPNNPKPSNFIIARVHAWDGQPWLVAEIVYPDATNYEGRKIMVYRTTVEKLREQKQLDPHFCEHKKHLSPFARFAPTIAGWKAALLMADMLNQQDHVARKGNSSVWDRVQEDDPPEDDDG
jgi:hypothetical protein